MDNREGIILTISSEKFRRGPVRHRLQEKLGHNAVAPVIDLRRESDAQPAGMLIEGNLRFNERRQLAPFAPDREDRIADVFYISEDKNFGPFTVGEINGKVDVAASTIILLLEAHGYMGEAAWLNKDCRIKAEAGEGVDSIHETALEYIYDLDKDLFAALQQLHTTPPKD